MNFHQLILGNVSYAVLLVICFLNNLKIAQYKTFPSSLFWRTTVGELTLFSFAGTRNHAAFRCSGVEISYWCCQRQCDKGAWSEPKLNKALAGIRATASPSTSGRRVSAGHPGPGIWMLNLPFCCFHSTLRGLPRQHPQPDEVDHVTAPLCQQLQCMLTVESKPKLTTTYPRSPHQSSRTILFLILAISSGLGFTLVCFLSCFVSC